MKQGAKPKLSVVVICFNMGREAQRTLYSLSRNYQRQVEPGDYQVIVIDNNSSLPLSKETVESFGFNFEYHYFDTESASPAEAINYGASLALGNLLACIVDGARMLSPGVIKNTLIAGKAFRNPLITSLAWHLGPKEQNVSMLEGYDQTTEDKLLESIDWQSDGYQLFDISTQASSSRVGFFGGIPEELSYFVIRKSVFLEMGGFCEEFQAPGGGLVSHDFLQRALKLEDLDIIMLLGEGSFHQFHGGVATNAIPEEHPFAAFSKEFWEIRGRKFELVEQPAATDINYLGSMPKTAVKFIRGRENELKY
ncbi:MAG: glycosyltransferase involved in cell wall biosynthesis [Arenicella sp.]|jgi:glycosyltransferase involved in cell wall biosynthesis